MPFFFSFLQKRGLAAGSSRGVFLYLRRFMYQQLLAKCTNVKWKLRKNREILRLRCNVFVFFLWCAARMIGKFCVYTLLLGIKNPEQSSLLFFFLNWISLFLRTLVHLKDGGAGLWGGGGGGGRVSVMLRNTPGSKHGNKDCFWRKISAFFSFLLNSGAPIWFL